MFLTRPLSRPLFVRLFSSDLNLGSVPDRVLIPAWSPSLDFDILTRPGTSGNLVLSAIDELTSRSATVIVDYGRIALQSHHGLYLCAEGGGGKRVLANRWEVGPWETFRLIGR